jgi:hypothetical protein
MLLWLACATFAVAQQRHATVQLEDGRTLDGVVLSMDLSQLQLEVGGVVQTLATAQIRSCRFREVGSAAAAPPEGGAAEADAGALPAVPPTPRRPGWVTLEEPQEVLRAAQFDPEAQPLDLRRRSLFRQRLEAIDEAYPWLCPAAPSQWASLGLSLFTLLTLVIYFSVKITGQELASMPRSMVLTVWYLLTGALQFGLVPALDIATVAILFGNTAFALFWLRALFGITRGAALLAYVVQVGCIVLGLGVLELADSILRSIGTTQL